MRRNQRSRSIGMGGHDGPEYARSSSPCWGRRPTPTRRPPGRSARPSESARMCAPSPASARSRAPGPGQSQGRRAQGAPLRARAQPYLSGMHQAVTEQSPLPDIEELSFEERLGLLVDRKLTARDDRRLQARLRKTKLRHRAANRSRTAESAITFTGIRTGCSLYERKSNYPPLWPPIPAAAGRADEDVSAACSSGESSAVCPAPAWASPPPSLPPVALPSPAESSCEDAAVCLVDVLAFALVPEPFYLSDTRPSLRGEG